MTGRRTSDSGRDCGRDRGLTLIELVVAMALFALIAVMGLQTLTGAMRSRERLTRLDTEAAGLSMTLSLLRADLRAVVPLLFHPPQSTGSRIPPQSALSFEAGRGRLGLSVAGQDRLPPVAGPGLMRVEWHRDPVTQRLSRTQWVSLSPPPRAGSGPAGPETAMQVLSGVRGWSVRSYWPDLGWRPGTDGGPLPVAPDPTGADGDGDGAPGALPNVYSSTLPLAIEVTLDTTQHGRIIVLEALK